MQPLRAITPLAEAPPAVPILSVSDLCTEFRSGGRWKPVLKDVSFEIAEGETVALVGESGSGKSVTAQSVMRLLHKRRARVTGSVMLGGRDLLRLPDRTMRAIRGSEMAMIFQEPMTSLNPVLTIGDQITEALLCHRALSAKAAKAEALAMLDLVRIPSARARFDDYPHQFSGGMRQRVMIAMALVCKPRLLIADEPTTALDVTIQAQILNLIKLLQEEVGMSVLFITHDMGVVAEMADRTAVMYGGEVVESGPTERIFHRPEAPYTRSLLSAVPELGSMAGTSLPARFAIADRATGERIETPDQPDTVDRTAPKLLEVTELTTRFDVRSGPLGRVTGRVFAVEKLSLDLAPGETLAIVGESGCGKSTAGRSILRLVPPTSGSVVLDGRQMMNATAEELRRYRRQAQMIFQDPYASLDPRKTIFTSIAEPMRTHGFPRKGMEKRVAELLHQVGLEPGMAKRYPHEFSGGQRQRICIARALSLEPKLILADEAVSALDVSVKAQVVNLFLDLQARLGIAYIFISHDMAVVERVAHRVAVMYLGEIVEIGPRRAVFENPSHPYTRKLLSAVPRPDPARRRRKAELSNDEIVNLVRPLDWKPPRRRRIEIAPGHYMLEDDGRD